MENLVTGPHAPKILLGLGAIWFDLMRSTFLNFPPSQTFNLMVGGNGLGRAINIMRTESPAHESAGPAPSSRRNNCTQAGKSRNRRHFCFDIP